MLSEGARVKAYDPHVGKLDLGSVELCSDVRSCLAGSDCCIIATREQVFRQVTRHLSVMNKPAIVDMVRLLDPELVVRRALYAALGLGPIPST